MFGSLFKLMKIKSGGEASISRSDIVNSIINLPDAKKNLSAEQFIKIKALYDEINKDKTKSMMRLADYGLEATIMKHDFNDIAPFSLYDGELYTKK